MQTSIERRRLRNLMDDGTVRAWLVLAKCAAGLTVLTLLSVMAASDERVMSGASAQRQAVSTALRNTVNAEAHRKQVFTQRQQYFKDEAGRRSVVTQTAEQSDSSVWASH